MRIALVGATGLIGSKLLTEAVNRGHTVTAICRHPEKIASHALVRAVRCDVMDTAALAREFQGQNAILHSYTTAADPVIVESLKAAVNQTEVDRNTALRADPEAFFKALISYWPADPAAHDVHVKFRIDNQVLGTRSIIAAAKEAGVKRVLAVGGAGTLRVDGVRSMDRPEFPKAFEGGAKSTAVIKDLLKEARGLEWTFLCPPTSIFPGERTGKFRLGLDDLLVAPDGMASISLEDYAMAMIDELETPRHTGLRFTVGY
jgi:uncharacterized protein